MNYFYPGMNSFSNEAVNEMKAVYMRMKPGLRTRECNIDESFLNISSAPGSLMRDYLKPRIDDFMMDEERQSFVESSRNHSLGHLPMFQNNRQNLSMDDNMPMGMLRSSRESSSSSLYYDFSSMHSMANCSSAFESFSSSSSQDELYTASCGEDDTDNQSSFVQSENESFSMKTQSSGRSSSSSSSSEEEDAEEDNSEMASELDEDVGEYCKGGYHPVRVGDVFCKRYHVLRKLGYGHFSTVWMCWDVKDQRYCAAKIVKSANHFSETARDEIRLFNCIKESKPTAAAAAAAATTNNKAIDSLYSTRVISLLDTFKVTGVNGTHHCLIFEALGDNLLTLIQRTNYRGLPLNNVKQIARQMLEALNFLHTKCEIIHTDLKPENVLLVLDDLQLRTQANEAAGNYIYFNKLCMESRRKRNSFVQNQSETNVGHQSAVFMRNEKLSKSQKKRLRAKIKRNINFFKTHREYLRDKGIEELLKLAAEGSLNPMTVVAAVTNQLSFMSFDDMQILSAKELEQVYRLKGLQLQQQDNNIPQGLRAQNDIFNSRSHQSPLFIQNSDYKKHILDECSDKLKLLLTSPGNFLRYVQECIQKQSHNKTNKFYNKRSHRKYKQQISGRHRKGCSCDYNDNDSLKSSESLASRMPPPLHILSSKDPARQNCTLNIKIADMGNGCWRYHHFTDDIQTREYRAIEVILGAGYDTPADIWSAACIFWELATGDYLFDPQYQRAANQDETHVANIIELCGPIPKDLMIHGEYSGDVFAINGELKNIKTLQERDLTQILINGYLWNPERAREFTEFLRPLLNVNPNRRVSADEALKHDWLNVKDDQTKYFRS